MAMTAADKQRRYRERHGNGDGNGDGNAVTGPVTDRDCVTVTEEPARAAGNARKAIAAALRQSATLTEVCDERHRPWWRC